MFSRSYYPKPTLPPTFFSDGPVAYRGGVYFAPTYFQPTVLGLFFVFGPVLPLFIVTDVAGATIAIASDLDRSIDLTGVLPDGKHTIGIQRRDAFGSLSAREVINVEVVGGVVSAALFRPVRVKAIALAGGMIAVEWNHTNDPKQAILRKWEIVDAADTSAILATVDDNPGDGRIRAELGPYSDGRSIVFAVRASDGLPSGRRGEFGVAPPVAAQDDAPVSPEHVIS